MKDTKIDWGAKLSSRKFWVALVGLISGLMLAFGADEGTVNNVSGVVMAAGSMLAYILGEAWTDAAGASAGIYFEKEAHPLEDSNNLTNMDGAVEHSYSPYKQ